MGMKIKVLPPSSRRQATVHRTVAFNFSSLTQVQKEGMAKRPFPLFGPSGETRTRGILLPKSSKNLYIEYSLFLGGFSQN